MSVRLIGSWSLESPMYTSTIHHHQESDPSGVFVALNSCPNSPKVVLQMSRVEKNMGKTNDKRTTKIHDGPPPNTKLMGFFQWNPWVQSTWPAGHIGAEPVRAEPFAELLAAEKKKWWPLGVDPRGREPRDQLGGGFKYVYVHPLEMGKIRFPFWRAYIFQGVWFNHQAVKIWKTLFKCWCFYGIRSHGMIHHHFSPPFGDDFFSFVQTTSSKN